MKKLISFKKNKIKSLDVNKVSYLKRRLKNIEDLNSTFNNYMPTAYNDITKNRGIKGSKKEINILSNENLKILKRLSTFAKEEILNTSSDFQKVNRKQISNIKSLDSLNSVKSKINKNKKRINPNISQFSFNSHKNNLSKKK